MNKQLPAYDDFVPLLNAACDGMLNDEQFHELTAALSSDVTLCKLFANHMQLLADMQLLGRAENACNSSLARVRATLCQPPSSHSLSPAPRFYSTTLHSTLTFLSSGWPVAYLIATVICGIGIMIGAFTYVSQPGQVAVRLSVVTKDFESDTSGTVGRITGMLNCQWSDPSTTPTGSNAVPLGRKYVLTSGLMEITYNMGAKVILQGPVTYEVGSENEGFLRVGKLTGKITTEDAKGFVIRTPTAVVTDLGTEFSVEVDETGETRSHVFRGMVEVRAVADGSRGQSIRLAENQSARVAPNGKTVRLQRIEYKTEHLIRTMPGREPKLYLHDTFTNPSDWDKSGTDSDGLNQYLMVRQSGVYHPLAYMRGGAFEAMLHWVQVGCAVAPSNRSAMGFAVGYGEAGWLALLRPFPRDVTISVWVRPISSHYADGKAAHPIQERDHESDDAWVALGGRGCEIGPDDRELPKATNAGAVLLIRRSGKWSYYENGYGIVEGRVPARDVYQLAMRFEGNRLGIRINDVIVDLDPASTAVTRTLRGRAAETKVNCVSLGAGNFDATGRPNGMDVSDVEDLVIVPTSQTFENW